MLEINSIILILKQIKILHCDLVDDGADLAFIEINNEFVEVLDPTSRP